MKKVYIVSTCNIWKNFDSFSLVGVFTSRKKLNPVLNKFLKEKKIEWNDTECTDRFVNKLSDVEINNKVDYIFVELVTLNEVQ